MPQAVATAPAIPQRVVKGYCTTAPAVAAASVSAAVLPAGTFTGGVRGNAGITAVVGERASVSTGVGE